MAGLLYGRGGRLSSGSRATQAFETSGLIWAGRNPKYLLGRCLIRAARSRGGPQVRPGARSKEEAVSRMPLFNSPFLLGFDHFERAVDRIAKMSAEGYPPYNIEQLGDNRLRITLAVAGFGERDLQI